MSFDPSGFASVADALVKMVSSSDKPEAVQRAAIGRYYFAALLCSRRFLDLSESQRVEHDKTHRWVIQKLRESDEPEAQLLTQALNALRIARNEADYGDYLADLPGDVKRAKAAWANIEKHLQTLSRRHVRR